MIVLLFLLKVVLLRYCFCMWLPCRKKGRKSQHFNDKGLLRKPLLVNQVEFLVEEMLKSFPRTELVGSIFLFSRIEQIVGKKMMAILVKYTATEACSTNTLP